MCAWSSLHPGPYSNEPCWFYTDITPCLWLFPSRFASPSSSICKWRSHLLQVRTGSYQTLSQRSWRTFRLTSYHYSLDRPWNCHDRNLPRRSSWPSGRKSWCREPQDYRHLTTWCNPSLLSASTHEYRSKYKRSNGCKIRTWDRKWTICIGFQTCSCVGKIYSRECP